MDISSIRQTYILIHTKAQALEAMAWHVGGNYLYVYQGELMS